MPLKYKFRQGFSKFVLRQAVREFIPINRRLDRKKIGLNFPIDSWFRLGLKNWIYEKLEKPDNPLYEFADFKAVCRILMNTCATVLTTV